MHFLDSHVETYIEFVLRFTVLKLPMLLLSTLAIESFHTLDKLVLFSQFLFKSYTNAWAIFFMYTFLSIKLNFMQFKNLFF